MTRARAENERVARGMANSLLGIIAGNIALGLYLVVAICAAAHQGIVSSIATYIALFGAFVTLLAIIRAVVLSYPWWRANP